MAGYDGYSMSKNARDAYDRGSKPLSKWNKAEIIATLKAEDAMEGAEKERLIKSLPTPLLKDLTLIVSEWHHTGSYYNKTDFYTVDSDKIADMTVEQIREALKAHKEHQEEEKRRKEEEAKGRPVKAHYLEWTGSRNYPHASDKIDTGIIRGNWFYPDHGYGKKSIYANGFYEIENT